ncbi:Hypothetical protein ORPV_1042 [Orpheovirus IHUMI-LCC2]|uniref:Uncharacterized protein n=1 Tax=Orpheovirus IHUMI-LCC2 TaxID=2023057 RepID=A0A2I2L603_9VIRU|nr:Hypothetical protein ORPV_1042 [Orpheovirus IHUMI-LCC2]SNW62946.1 Hypothetical protein ORPV_1042 [Orpheovirus IHUMI-LCC2]
MDIKNIAGDSGLIFIQSHDAVGRITMAITKQEYSTIGLYYTTTFFNGKINHAVLLIDVFGLKPPTWCNAGITIQDIVNNPLVTKVVVKPLKSIYHSNGSINTEATNLRKEQFRRAIASIWMKGVSLDIQQSLYQLFGYRYKNSTNRPVSAIEMVNKVVKTMGYYDQIEQSGSKVLDLKNKLSVPDFLESNTKGQIDFLTNMALPLNQQVLDRPSLTNKVIQSYFGNNPLFENGLMEVPVKSFSSVEIENARSDSLRIQNKYIISCISVFFDLFLKDEDFYTTVINGFNDGKKIEMLGQENLRAILGELNKEIYHTNAGSNERVIDTLNTLNMILGVPVQSVQSLSEEYDRREINTKVESNPEVQVQIREVIKEVVREVEKPILRVVKEVVKEKQDLTELNDVVKQALDNDEFKIEDLVDAVNRLNGKEILKINPAVHNIDIEIDRPIEKVNIQLGDRTLELHKNSDPRDFIHLLNPEQMKEVTSQIKILNNMRNNDYNILYNKFTSYVQDM